jgi:tripartite ATP-independent transporter DctP family solute receptor
MDGNKEKEMNKATKPVLRLSALLSLLVLALCGVAAAGTIRLQIAHADPSNNSSPNHQLNYRFKELIEARSNGRFEIEVIGDSALGSENEYFAGIKMGMIQMASCTNSTVSQNTKSLMVFDLPFMFADNEAAKAVCQSDWAKSLWGQAAVDSDAVILGVTCSGFRQLITMKVPVRSPADMKGLKIRVIPNDIFVATMEALGASAVPMGFAEVLTGLQQGTIDGFDLPINPFGANSVSEVVKYCMITNHFFTPYYLIIAKSVFDTLSAEDQALVRECAAEACDWNFNVLWENMEKDNRALIEKKGVTIIEDVDIPAFQKACAGIWEKYRNVIGSDILDECVRLSAEATAKAKAGK